MARGNLFQHRRAINCKTNTANANKKKWNAKMSEPTSDIKDGNFKIEEWSAAISSGTGEPSTPRLIPHANEKKLNAKMSEPTSDIKDGNSKMRNSPQQLLLTYYTYTARGKKHPSSRRQSREQNYTSRLLFALKACTS